MSPPARLREVGHLEQVDALEGGDVAGTALEDLPVARPVEQCGNPELQIHAGGHEQICVPQHGHKAGLRLHEVRILVALGNRGDGAAVTHNLPGDRTVGGEAGDDLYRRGGGAAGRRGSRLRECPGYQ